MARKKKKTPEELAAEQSAQGLAVDPAKLPVLTSAVTVSLGLLNHLKMIAAERTNKDGRKVTARELAEAAIVEKYGLPDMPQPVEQLLADEPERQSARIPLLGEMLVDPAREFEELFAAAIGEPAEGEPDPIWLLDGALPVPTSEGLVLRQRLAYHLRDAINAGQAIVDLDALVGDFVGAGV